MKTPEDLTKKIHAICEENFMNDGALDEKFEAKIECWKNGIVLLESGISEQALFKQRSILQKRNRKSDAVALEVLDFIVSSK